VRLSHVHLLGAKEWIIFGFVAIRRTLVNELEVLDNMLRENQADSLKRRLQIIDAWVEDREKMTDDGALVSPTCFFKTNVADNWKACGTQFMKDLHQRYNERLPFHYLWCALKNGPLSGCCLATLAGAMRHGIATLHPKTEDLGYMYMQHLNCHVQALYTLSGYIRSNGYILNN
jgi:hypothetical protein